VAEAGNPEDAGWQELHGKFLNIQRESLGWLESLSPDAMNPVELDAAIQKLKTYWTQMNNLRDRINACDKTGICKGKGCKKRVFPDTGGIVKCSNGCEHFFHLDCLRDERRREFKCRATRGCRGMVRKR
jgi:hypothetical protein